MNYSISEFANLTGFSTYTLRYYEKEQILKPARQNNNHRFYSDRDVEWIKFIARLKETGMPLKNIKKYAQLREEGNTTVQQRMTLLIEHNDNLEAQLTVLSEHLVSLKQKINHYEQLIK
ncbi:MerR family transcriptional regulator [Providencia sp. Je.9.19]|uniref:MerR family transcriptional regulator n=1 Tax=Providencia sp. Je.9.19 TaxID=3142844 RepID=UPI003DA7EFDF